MFSKKAKNIPPFYVMEVLERAQELERSGRHIIHMEVGEPDFPTAPHINQAAINALKGGETKYTHSPGLPQLREAVARNITSRTRAIMINSPSNPTGHVMHPDTLKGVSQVAGDIPIISDEIYQGLIYKGEDHSILKYTDNAFILNGFSKLYAMTGLRLGYLIAPPEYIMPLQKIQQNFFICANSFFQHAGVAALEGPQDHVKEMVSTYDKRRGFILDRLKYIGFGIHSEPDGAYYVLANAKEGMDRIDKYLNN